MNFSVTKLAPVLVGPSDPTPAGNLPLSSIDLTPALRDVMVDSIHVFQHGVEPARVIREALSKALIHYYPVAGRLLKCDGGDMVVACTGEGAWFVEATANFSLKDVNDLQRPLMIPKEEFLPVPPTDESQEGVIFMMQVCLFCNLRAFTIFYLTKIKERCIEVVYLSDYYILFYRMLAILVRKTGSSHSLVSQININDFYYRVRRPFA